MSNGLTTKQEVFVYAYIGEARFNATKAATIAGYSKARQSGSENLSHPVIAARVTEELERRSLTAQQVLDELKDVAVAPWGRFVREVEDPKTGELLPIGMDLKAKVQALDLLGKHHKLFTDKVQHDGSEDFLSALRAFGGATGGHSGD